MKKAKFDFYKPWRKEDLPKNARAKMEKIHGIESGPTYVGGVNGAVVYEVPQCPYCGTGTYDTHRCKHLVLYYDSTNGEYGEINPSFRNHVTKVLDTFARKVPRAVSESLEDALSSIKLGQFPRPSVLDEVIEGFSFSETFDQWGIHGIGFGYAGDQLLAKLQGGKSSSKKK